MSHVASTTLEHALLVWAQATIENIMQPTYIGLMRLLIAELPRFPRLGSLFAQAVPQQGGAFLKALLVSTRSHGVLGGEDLEPVIRLLTGSLLTYALGGGLFAPDGIPQPPPSEQVATLVRLVLQGSANHG